MAALPTRAGQLSANPGPVRLEIIESTEGFDALQEEWDSLVDQMATRSPFVRWDWMRGWWNIHAPEFELCLILCRDLAGRVVGIAPFVIGYDRQGSRHHLNQLYFLAGCGAAQGERLDFIVPAGTEAFVMPELARGVEILQTRWDAMQLNRIPEESPNLPHLRRVTEAAGIRLTTLNRSVCRLTKLPDSMEKFQAGRGGDWKRNLNRTWRQLVTQHGAQKGVAGRDAAPMETFDRLRELHLMRVSRGRSLFAEPDAWRFHRALAEKWLWSGRSVLTFIQTRLGISAATLALRERDEAYLFQLGWDPEFARYSLGRQTVRWSIEHSIDHGASIYDTLSGEARYKTELSDGCRQVLDLEAFHPHSANASLFRWLRGLKRRCLPRQSRPSPLLLA